MSRFTPAVLVTALFLLAPLTALAQPAGPDPAPVRPTIRKATLFKNGLAFIEMDVPVPAGDHWIPVLPPSLPLHGSYWVSHDPARLTVRESVAELVRIEERTPAQSLPELLRANLGRDVTLTADGQEFVGTLVAYPGTEMAPEREPAWPGTSAPEPSPGQLLLLKTFRGTVALNPGSVSRAIFDGAEAVLDYARQRSENRLRVRVEKAVEGAVFRVQYLTYGLAWAPSYRVDLTEDGKAVLEARTDVLNDALHLDTVPTVLVSGFPNLRFMHVAGALAMTQQMNEFVQSLSQDPAQRSFRREQVVAQNIYSNAAFQAEAGLASVTTQGFEGEAREDMFFNELGPVSLRKGGRGNWPLFRAEVPCEQVFRWEVADYLNQQGYYQAREQERAPEEVWHSLRLTNVTNAPWTTAPLTVLKGGAVLGQDIGFYTPSGGRTLVKVTKALNLRAEEQEHEIDRKREAERLYGADYDLVTIEGTLYLCSYKSHDVTVEIAKTLSGDVQKTEENPTVVKLGRGLQQVNPLNRLNWRLTLPAGKETRIHYQYQVLVRR